MSRGRRSSMVFAVAIALTIALVSLAVLIPQAALAVPGAVAVFLVVRYSWARAAFFMFGAFLVFQTSAGLSAPKLFYFAVVGVSVLVSVTKLKAMTRTPSLRALRPAYFGALGIVLWQLLIVLPYSVGAQGVRLEDWLRDGATYVLIGSAVIIALDALETSTRRLARTLVVLVGALAAFSFASRWISARGLVDAQANTGADNALMSSLTALTLAVALAFAMALVGRRMGWIWLAVGVVFVFAILVTGTRTGVVFGAVLLGLVGRRGKQRAPIFRVLAAATAGVLAVVVAIPLTAPFFSNDNFLAERFGSIWGTIKNGVASDQSGAIRTRAYEYCVQVFQENVLLGRGEGLTFVNPTTGLQGTDFSVDSPLVYLAKFGILGCLILFACLVFIFLPLVRRAPGFEWTVENTAVRGCVAILVSLLPFGATLEDKGFAITAALAVLLVGSALQAQRPASSDLLPSGQSGEPSLGEPRERRHQIQSAPAVPPSR